MTRENIINFLKENGFKPRKEIKDMDSYLRQLRDRLKRDGRNLYIDEQQNKIWIGEYTKRDKYTQSFNVKFSEEQTIRFKKLAEEYNISLSELIRNLLERECSK